MRAFSPDRRVQRSAQLADALSSASSELRLGLWSKGFQRLSPPCCGPLYKPLQHSKNTRHDVRQRQNLPANIPGDPAMNIEKVVVGLDFSDAAIGAATWVHEAFAPDARLIFVHALESDRDRFLPQATYPTSLEVSLHEAAAERAREIGPLLTAPSTRVEVRSGGAHDVIREIATNERADLIVVGPNGDHSSTSPFLG